MFGFVLRNIFPIQVNNNIRPCYMYGELRTKFGWILQLSCQGRMVPVQCWALLMHGRMRRKTQPSGAAGVQGAVGVFGQLRSAAARAAARGEGSRGKDWQEAAGDTSGNRDQTPH